MDNSEKFLSHHGVKGMKWGVRREDPSDRGGPKPKKPPKLTRKEVRAEKKAFYDKKAQDLGNEIFTKQNDVLVSVFDSRSGITNIVTGKEFATHLANGGWMDVKTTDIWARKTAAGNFQQVEAQRFKRSDGRFTLG